MTEPALRKSDLGVRVVSAVVMVAVAGTALWLGGLTFAAFAIVFALGILWEWWGLVSKLTQKLGPQLAWIAAGALYIGTAATVLVRVREASLESAILVLLSVIAVDVGAYFVGRAIGGPKIAPRISPSKTWAGLAGGVLGASILFAVWSIDYVGGSDGPPFLVVLLTSLGGGASVAIVAQTGDFFESWMKRRAGVKDSGSLIPGHGGLFDRTDGLIAVLFVFGIVPLVQLLAGWGPPLE